MAPAKLQDDFIIDDSAKALAESYLDQMRSSAGKEDDGSDDDAQDFGQVTMQRPSRLGLGAKYIPHSQALNINDPAAHRLGDKLKGQHQRKSKEKLGSAPASRRGADEDDEGESRTKVVKKQKGLEAKKQQAVPVDEESALPGKKKRKRNKKGTPSVEESANDSKADAAEPERAAGDRNDGAKRPEKKAGLQKSKKRAMEEGEDANTRPSKKIESKVEPAQIPNKEEDAKLGEEGEEGGNKKHFNDPPDYVHKPRRKRVKGKKTRSKQKNIRRDNRPAHLKPGYQAAKE